MHWLDGFHMAWTWLAWIVILGVAVWLAVWAVRSGLAAPHGPSESPEEILRRRFASGEIDETELERRLAELRR